MVPSELFPVACRLDRERPGPTEKARLLCRRCVEGVFRGARISSLRNTSSPKNTCDRGAGLSRAIARAVCFKIIC